MTRRQAISFLSLIVLLVSCKPKAPAGVLPQGRMVEVLTDYHLAQGIYDVQGSSDADRYMLLQSVFRKHNISEAVFDSSMLWYSGHSEKLEEVYAKVNERIEFMTAQSASSQAVTRSRYADLSSEGDSCNLWTFATHTNLQPTPLRGLYRFSLKADSTYCRGDRFIWYFRAQHYQPDGSREAYAQLAVNYATDTVASYTQSIDRDGEMELTVTPNEALDTVDIVSLNGFVYMPAKADESSLRMVMLRDIALVRIHKAETEHDTSETSEEDAEPSDSTNTDSLSATEGRRSPMDLRDAKPHDTRYNIQKLRPIQPAATRRQTRRRSR